VGWSCDGRRLASSSNDGTARIYPHVERYVRSGGWGAGFEGRLLAHLGTRLPCSTSGLADAWRRVVRAEGTHGQRAPAVLGPEPPGTTRHGVRGQDSPHLGHPRYGPLDALGRPPILVDSCCKSVPHRTKPVPQRPRQCRPFRPVAKTSTSSSARTGDTLPWATAYDPLRTKAGIRGAVD